jgi:hypothetical protein
MHGKQNIKSSFLFQHASSNDERQFIDCSTARVKLRCSTSNQIRLCRVKYHRTLCLLQNCVIRCTQPLSLELPTVLLFIMYLNIPPAFPVCKTGHPQPVLTNYRFNPLTPELNPSAQRCLTRFFTRDFASWTVDFVNICVKNQQITNYSFSLLIMYGISHMFRHYIAVLGERS